jgi:hypothetical protein
VLPAVSTSRKYITYKSAANQLIIDGAAVFLGGRDNDIFRNAFTPFEGAITPLWAAAHPEPAQDRKKYAGSFLLPYGGWKEPSALARNADAAKQLWETSEKILEKVLN